MIAVMMRHKQANQHDLFKAETWLKLQNLCIRPEWSVRPVNIVKPQIAIVSMNQSAGCCELMVSTTIRMLNE